MKKGIAFLPVILITVILVMGTLFVYAADGNMTIGGGEVHKGDLITGGSIISNDGVIQGDLIVGAQTLHMGGRVEGDVIAAGSEMKINGEVLGNVRTVASTISLGASVERSAMIIGSAVTLEKDAVVGRSTYLIGNTIRTEGTVKGKTEIFGSDVTLGGTFEGDVIIHDMMEGSVLRFLPGTVVKGKMTYKGINDISIPGNVRIESYEYVKVSPKEKPKQVRFDLWQLARKIFTLIAYYLFALLLYKFFPKFFVRSGDFIGQKPLSAAGVGIATLGSLVGGSLLLILLLILAIVLFKGSVFFFAGLVFTFLITITVLFADIPVSLWLGGQLTKNGASVPARLAIGLAIITAVKLAVYYLGSIEAVSVLTGVFSFLLNAAIWVMGTGALLKTLFDILKAANKKAEEEELIPEEL